MCSRLYHQGRRSALPAHLGWPSRPSQPCAKFEPPSASLPLQLQIPSFFNLFPFADISINEALALGDKLASAVLYHVVPGAFTEDQLAEKTKLPTLLSQNTGADYPITVGKDSAGKVRQG